MQRIIFNALENHRTYILKEQDETKNELVSESPYLKGRYAKYEMNLQAEVV